MSHKYMYLLVNTSFGWHGFNLVGQCFEMHGPETQSHRTVGIDPRQRVFHPVDVIAVREVLAGLGTTALLAILRRDDRRGRLQQQVFQFQRLDQIRIPDQPAISDFYIFK